MRKITLMLAAISLLFMTFSCKNRTNDMTFSFTDAEITHNSVQFTVTPSDLDQEWFFGILPSTDVDGKDDAQVISETMEMDIFFKRSGVLDCHVQNLLAETDYVALAYASDNAEKVARYAFRTLAEPETPENPEDPEIPENPETPEDPDTPVDPEDPETPEDPEEPGDPEIPEEPIDPIVELVVDKTVIKDTGADKATFTVYVDGVDLTSESVIYNITEGKDLEANVFVSETAGFYVFSATYNCFKSEEVKVQVKEARAYAPGDFYNENGVKGVVFHLLDEEGTSGYIMSMDEAYLEWSTEYVWANCTSGRGEWNTEDMLKLGADKYPAAKWCVEHGNGWYMPSSKELNYMWNAVSNGTHVFDEEFIKLYNDKLDDPISMDYYWSSNETSEDMAEVVAFIDQSVVCLNPVKTSCFNVRAIYKF